MSLAHLRPLTAGEILDGAFVLYRRHFGVLVAAALIPQLPVAAYHALAPAAGVAADGAGQGGVQVYDLLVTIFFWGALVHLCAAAVQGGDVSLAAAYRRARGVFPVLLGQTLLGALATGAAALLLLVPGIAVYILLFLAPHAVVVEGRGVSDSLARSWSLTRPEWRRAAGVLTVSGIISMLPLLLLGAAEEMAGTGTVWAASASGVLQTLLYALAYPLIAASATLLYFDCRVRAEALDLEADAMAVPA